jgi:hypothetical protein
MLTHEERQNIEIGQRVYLFTPGHGIRNPGTYSEPLKVIGVTKTQFTVESGQNSKRVRFTKSMGRKVGVGNYSRFAPSATLVTSATSREVNKFNAKKESTELAKVAKAGRVEIDLRDKYNAMDVSDEEIQTRFLAPLRAMAEDGETEMNELLEKFQGVTVKEENFWRISDAIARETRDGYFAYGLRLRDISITFHATLVNIVLEYNTGSSYMVGDTVVSNLHDLLFAKTRQTLSEQLDRFFGYTFSSNDPLTEADQKFVSALREIMKDSFSSERVTKIKEEASS